MRHKFLRRSAAGVTMLELIIALTILGLLAALAIPTFSRGSEPDISAQLRERLVRLRTAIELYYQDHSAYPGANGSDEFVRQLTLRSNLSGATEALSGSESLFGPYLASGVPRSPFCAGRDAVRIIVVRGDSKPTPTPGSDADWVYNADTGYIAVNSTGVDTEGQRFDAY